MKIRTWMILLAGMATYPALWGQDSIPDGPGLADLATEVAYTPPEGVAYTPPAGVAYTPDEGLPIPQGEGLPIPLGRGKYGFQPRQLIAPALFIGMGAWGLADKNPVEWLEQKARDDMNPHGHSCKADEVLQYVPSGLHVVLGFVPGTRPRHNFRDRAMASATAHMLMAGVCNTVKYTVKERRPDSSKRNSYFSGHTATAFTGAELTRIEYGWGYGAAAYAMAAATGYLRVWNKRHWVGDVLTGAGVGILCADAGYWLLPVWKRCFGIDKRDARRRIKKESRPAVVAAPFYLQDNKAGGLSCSIVL